MVIGEKLTGFIHKTVYVFSKNISTTLWTRSLNRKNSEININNNQPT